MRKTYLYWLGAVLLVFMAVSMGCRVFAPKPTATPTNTATPTVTPTLTSSPTPTVTATATIASTRTPRPTAAQTVQPIATLNPVHQSFKDLFYDDNKLAMLYTQNVEIVRSEEETVAFADGRYGYTAAVPTGGLLYHFTISEIDTIYNSFMDLQTRQEFSMKLVSFAAENDINMHEIKQIQVLSIEAYSEEYGRITHSEGEDLSVDGIDGYFHFVIAKNDDLVRYTAVLCFIIQKSEQENVVITLQTLQTDVTQAQAEEAIDGAKEYLLSAFESYTDAPIQSNSLFSMDYYVFTGLCPTAADDTLGFALSNPIYISPGDEYFSDYFERMSIEETLEDNYLNNLLYQGQPVEYEKQGSMASLNGEIEVYQVTAPGMPEPIKLYLRAQTPSPYMVPSGFGCTGLLYPDYLLSLYEELTKDTIDS